MLLLLPHISHYCSLKSLCILWCFTAANTCGFLSITVSQCHSLTWLCIVQGVPWPLTRMGLSCPSCVQWSSLQLLFILYCLPLLLAGWVYVFMGVVRPFLWMALHNTVLTGVAFIQFCFSSTTHGGGLALPPGCFTFTNWGWSLSFCLSLPGTGWLCIIPSFSVSFTEVALWCSCFSLLLNGVVSHILIVSLLHRRV